jgi:hypothetical protein
MTMINSVKARTPILALILFAFAIGYSFADRVVVIPLGADAPAAVELPVGMVSAFSSETCPAGWQIYANAQGRFVVGLNSGGNLGLTKGDAIGNLEDVKHGHIWGYYNAFTRILGTYDSDGNMQQIIDWDNTGIGDEGSGFFPFAADASTSSGSFYTTNAIHTPPYVQLLYCEKV